MEALVIENGCHSNPLLVRYLRPKWGRFDCLRYFRRLWLAQGIIIICLELQFEFVVITIHVDLEDEFSCGGTKFILCGSTHKTFECLIQT